MTHPEISLRPAAVYAFLKVCPLLLLDLCILILAWLFLPVLIILSWAIMVVALYNYFSIRSYRYLITGEYIRITKGIFFKRVDQVEMYRIKDYILIRSLLMQLFGLMNVTLSGTDKVNPVIALKGIPVSGLIDEIRERVQEARQHNNIYELN